MAVPLFPGVPGGPELLVVLLLLVALFGVPLVVAFLGWQYLRGDGRVDELEARVRELESELDDADDADEGGGTRTERPDDPRD
jgi:sec-independent protein translocase protein TatA